MMSTQVFGQDLFDIILVSVFFIELLIILRKDTLELQNMALLKMQQRKRHGSLHEQ